MAKYKSVAGYTGTNYDQSVIWSYKTDIDRNVLARWFVNIYEQGVLKYTPSATGQVGPTIAAGTSFLIKQKDATSPNEKIAKVDMIYDYTLPVYGDAAGYALIAMWENAADEYRGVEFYLKTPAEMVLIVAAGYNYVQFGTVEIDSTAGAPTPGWVVSNTTVGMTQAGMSSGLLGYSGYSGIGLSGFSGYSGDPAANSGFSGWSGTSGEKGDIGPGGGDSGFSGWSGVSGYSSTVPGSQGTSGYSGRSGFSGLTGSECILLTCSDETTPLTTGTKITFRMPYAMSFLYGRVKASLTTASSVGITDIDVRKAGLTILSASISMGPTEEVKTGAGFSTTSLVENDKITVYLSSVGTGATGLKVYLIGNKA
jgi:hypothetical protein